MPVKKGTKKSSGSKTESGGAAVVTQLVETFPDLDIRPERWINLKVKLVTWDHLDFSVVLRTSTRLYTIVDKVKERHGGSIQDIILYRHQVHPQNILLDLGGHPPCPGCTLDEVGFDGGSKNDPKEEVICYDYQAHDSDCPLLLSSPRGASRKDVAKKVAAEAVEEARVKNAHERSSLNSGTGNRERRKSIAQEQDPPPPVAPGSGTDGEI